jgi:uncharacterized protein (DUF2164 family)
MSEIKISKQDKEAIVNKIQLYFNDELDQKIGQFDAEFLLDFFLKEVGGYFYNQALADALQVIESKVEDISDTFYSLEHPTHS